MRSIHHRHTGQILTMASSKKLGPWRDAVAVAAREYGIRPTDAPVQLKMRFYFKRPKAAKNRVHHAVPPDTDKLCRAIFDALTGVAYEDDSQVFQVTGSKHYCLGGSPECAVIEIEVVQ